MSWTWVLRSREIDLFRGCRRQWDLGAMVRRGLVPVERQSVFDLEAAVRMGLAVYGFPALDDWSRDIVRPLAIKGFNRAMSEQASAYEKTRPLTPDQAADWQRHRRLGESLLARYFAMAEPADAFDSIFSDELIWTSVPIPDDTSHDLGLPGGRPIRFVTRIDQLVSEPNDEHWVVDHRVVYDRYTEDAALLADDEQQRAIWALETAYPQLLVSGTIYNELLVGADDPDRFAAGTSAGRAAGSPGLTSVELTIDADARRDMTRVRHPSGAAARRPVSPDAETIAARSAESDRIDRRIQGDGIRRTFIRRSRESVASAGALVARDIDAMIDPRVDVSPSPSPERCPRCPFLAPCTAMNEGRDVELQLLTQFRVRGDEELEDAGLRRSDERSEQGGGRFGTENHANFRWS